MKNMSWLGIGTAVTAASVGLFLASSSTSIPWTPPIGIPAPAFGINEVAPAMPSPWTANVAGFYYVQAGGTNAGNGYPGSPKAQIPQALTAGSVVIVSGTYNVNHSNSPITGSGTAAAPVYIRGVGGAAQGVITQKWEVAGSYYIIENLNATWANSSGNGKLLVGGNHGVVRHGDFKGDTGTGVGGLYPGGSSMVVWDNKLHDFGDVAAATDQDNHCISVVSGTDHLWIVDNELARCSGNGLQINAGDDAHKASLHHIYVGRNVAHHNKQDGLWTKQATDVIFSQNESYEARRDSGSSPGSCMGSQYGPDRVWFLFNNCHDSEMGFYTGSDSGGSAKDNYYIGNVIHAIHSAKYHAGDSWSPGGAFVLAGGKGGRVVAGNTITDVDGGIQIPGDGANRIADNIISVTQGLHVFVDGNTVSGSCSNNLTDVPAKLAPPGSTPKVVCTAGQVGAPGFVGATDFHLTAGSPAMDHGVLEAAYATFQSLYGISIAVDFDGKARPAGAGWDIGAFEAGGIAPSYLWRRRKERPRPSA